MRDDALGWRQASSVVGGKRPVDVIVIRKRVGQCLRFCASLRDANTVLGSIGVPDLRALYFVEWDSSPYLCPREPNFENFVKQIFSKRSNSNSSTLIYLYELTHVLPHLLNIANNPNLSDWKARHIEYRSNHCHGEG